MDCFQVVHCSVTGFVCVLHFYIAFFRRKLIDLCEKSTVVCLLELRLFTIVRADSVAFCSAFETLSFWFCVCVVGESSSSQERVYFFKLLELKTHNLLRKRRDFEPKPPKWSCFHHFSEWSFCSPSLKCLCFFRPILPRTTFFTFNVELDSV